MLIYLILYKIDPTYRKLSKYGCFMLKSIEIGSVLGVHGLTYSFLGKNIELSILEQECNKGTCSELIRVFSWFQK